MTPHPPRSSTAPGWTPLCASKRVLAMPLVALTEEGRQPQPQQQQHHGHHAAAKQLAGGLQPAGLHACNDHRCCAERRLIEGVVAEARRRGVRPHKLGCYVRRRLGGGVWILRVRADGSPGCSAPCTLCARELEKYDLKVCCVTAEGQPWCGRLSDPGAPPAHITSGQRGWLTHWATCKARAARGKPAAGAAP